MKSREKGRLSSQPDANPKNVSSIVIQNGKDLEVSNIGVPNDKNEDGIEKEIEQVAAETLNKVTFDTPTSTKTNVAPFPCRLEKPKKDDKNKEMMEMFRKVELNIPLLDATSKCRNYVETNALLLAKAYLPFYNVSFLLNVEIQEIGIIIQLADRTNAYPEGMIEDVLVQVNELIFPVDFYVLDMHDDNFPNPAPILLGRPFMCTAQTKIDVKQGILYMEFDGEKVQFNIFDIMKYLEKSNTLCSVNVIDKDMQKVLGLHDKSILDIKLKPHSNQLKLEHAQLNNDDVNLAEKVFCE
ncbi:uncharacterized protein LOC127239557 [Andrographis paniculata]|uniref:uncharacterized protein LOC127239557 n=1 Tax=Andrographis paniculata TaxID=175694 RepID=UPI0021E75E98|nr:uncharacterized protein LOC127239557 [Andrographis paniculata]